MSDKKPLNERLKPFCARYRIVLLVNVVQHTLFFTAVACLVYCLLDKLIYVDLDTGLVAWVAGAAATAFLLVKFLVQTPDQRYVSYLIDHRSGLKNLVGSGLDAAGETGPVASTVIERANNELNRQKPSDVMPLRFNWAGRYCLLPLIAVLGVFHLMPEQDLFRRAEAARIKKEETLKRQKSAKLINETVQRLEELGQRVKSIDGKSITQDMQTLARDLEDTPTRKEALNKLSSLEKRYREEFNRQKKFEEATKNLEANLDAKDLSTESKSLLKKLADDLRNKNFDSAADVMRQLAEQMREADLSKEQKKALARELGNLMKQMKEDRSAQRLAKNLDKMQDSKQKQNESGENETGDQKNQGNASSKNKDEENDSETGGQKQAQDKQGDPKQGDPNGQGEKNAAGMNKEGNKGQPNGGDPSDRENSDKEQFAENQTKAADQMDEMAKSLEEMEALKKMQEGLADAKREMVGEEFKDFDVQAMEDYLDGEGQGMGQGQGKGNGQGQGQGQGNGQGEGQGQGGTGGQGQGQGGVVDEERTKTGFEKQLSPSQRGKGKVLNQTWVYGVPEKGDARENYSAEVRNAREKAMSSLARNPVPPDYQEMVKDYFSSLEPGKEKRKD